MSDDAQRSLADLIVPRDVAEKALALYDRVQMGTDDPIYALQRATVFIAEELNWWPRRRAEPYRREHF